MSSKKLIAQQIVYKLQGGYKDSASPVDYRDIYKAIEQKINSDFKTQYFAQTLASGDTIPEHAMIATYENIAIREAWNGLKSEATLPITPISLPRNMGIWNIYVNDKNVPQTSFIPLQPAQANLLRSQVLINDLMGQVGYTPSRNKVTFETNLLYMDISEVTMELLVLDISQYEETETLPIPPDYEVALIDYLTKIFAPIQSGDKDNDVYTEQNPVKK